MGAPNSGDGSARTALQLLGLKFVDLVTYAVAFVGAVVLPLGVAELTLIGGLVVTKWLLFVFGGFLAMYASLQLRPASPKRRVAAADAGPNSATVGGPDLSRFQRLVATLPPARWTGLEPHEQFSPYTKLLAGSIGLLAVSWLLEAAFDVAL